jgi:hypothetical protein
VNIQARFVSITAWVMTPLWGGWWCSAVDQPLAHCAELQPTRPVSGRQAELAPRLLADQGRNVAEYLAVLRDARVIAGTEWKLCVLDLRLDQKIDGASGCLHSCMHCGEAQGDTMEACVHRMLYCSAVQSSVDEFLSGLWPKAELGSTHGIGLGVFYSVSRMER